MTQTRASRTPVKHPEAYPPKLDPEIVKAIHWCRLGRLRPSDETAFHRAKQMGLLAQDSVWRATAQGEGVLIALGLLDGRPAPGRVVRVVLWAVCDRYRVPHFVTTWSEWENEVGYADRSQAEADWRDRTDDSGWRFWTTFEQLDLPDVPEGIA